MFNRFKNMDPEVFKKYDTSSMKSLMQSSAPLPFSTKQWIIENFCVMAMDSGFCRNDIQIRAA